MGYLSTRVKIKHCNFRINVTTTEFNHSFKVDYLLNQWNLMLQTCKLTIPTVQHISQKKEAILDSEARVGL